MQVKLAGNSRYRGTPVMAGGTSGLVDEALPVRAGRIEVVPRDILVLRFDLRAFYFKENGRNEE